MMKWDGGAKKPKPPKLQYIDESTGDVYERSRSGKFVYKENLLGKKRKKRWLNILSRRC